MRKDGPVSDVDALLERNRRWQSEFDSGDLGIPPRLSTVILTCVDARLNPTHLFGLELGDALILRNTGGRVTDGVLVDLAVLGTLSANWPGDVRLEVVVIHHTNCGMQRLTDPEMRSRVASRAGVGADAIGALAIAEPVESVREDVEKIRRAAAPGHEMKVTGLVYDVTDGTLTEVV